MHKIEAIALFCEDIRDELNGMHSLVGIFGDNVNVSQIPGAMPKLAIYVRIHVPSDYDPCKFDIFIQQPGEDRQHVNSITLELVQKTLMDARKADNPIAGIISKVIAAPFPVLNEGRLKVELEFENEKLHLGGLNFKMATT